MIDETRIHGWLAAYRHPLSAGDPAEVAALFTSDVRYSTAPYRAPLKGIEALIAYRLGENEDGIPCSFEHQILALKATCSSSAL